VEGRGGEFGAGGAHGMMRVRVGGFGEGFAEGVRDGDLEMWKMLVEIYRGFRECLGSWEGDGDI